MEWLEQQENKIGGVALSIHRVQSGLIFDDGFDTLDSRWVVSPSDSYNHEGATNTLSLQHNAMDRSTNALFSLPQEEELLFQVQADYTPTMLGDAGGIVIWKNALEKVEFLESEDGTQVGEYSTWRAIKRQNLWTFFAERGGAWELFDSTICIDPTMAGVMLKGIERTGYVPLNLKRAILCKGTSVSVGNLDALSKLILLDNIGNVVSEQIVPEGYSGVTVELPAIPFTGKFNLYIKNQEGIYVLAAQQEEIATMYGGDVFLKGTDLKIIWNGKQLSEITPTHLGALKHNVIEQKMIVLNDNIDSVAENVTISVAIYLEEYGWEWCDIALDINGQPDVYQDKTVLIGSLLPDQSKDFWIKVTRPETTNDEDRKQQMRPTHFYLEVRNE